MTKTKDKKTQDKGRKRERRALYPWRPGWVMAPGEILREWLDENGLTAGVLAVACAGRARRDDALAAIGDVLAHRELTEDHARLLAGGTGIPVPFWMGLEHNYRAGLAAGLPEWTDNGDGGA